MSDMYKAEVPQYGTLMGLVADINRNVVSEQSAVRERSSDDLLERLSLERHGAIRVGTARELFTMRRLFAVMGMQPVGYYDLSIAGVPVHATAFRPVSQEALQFNPFRIFCSLLRLDLIEDPGLRDRARDILASREIFTRRCLELIERFEMAGGLQEKEAIDFVDESLQTFRWHSEATVDLATYRQFRHLHPLIADVVCFKGPHINHLTPRTLYIEAVQKAMPERGIRAKAVIEGPPRRDNPILLRQTSFMALQEPVTFVGQAGRGTHTARFGEIEQRGCALTPKGRALYDRLLAAARAEVQDAGDGSNAEQYVESLTRHFRAFPDDLTSLRREGLAFFHYRRADKSAVHLAADSSADIEKHIEAGTLTCTPITYEDFLPVSAAGIFQSNLGNEGRRSYESQSQRTSFEEALGAPLLDEMALYATAERASLEECTRIFIQCGDSK